MALIQCRECGKEISAAASVCPHCGAPVIKEIFCSKCGKKIPENSEFCPECGCPLRPATPGNSGKKDRVTTALLGIFLGSIGIHYFYLGKTTAGLITILLSICSCGIWGLLMFIQSIIILTMNDEDFTEKYVKTEKTLPLF